MRKLKIIWLILKERRHQDKIWGCEHDKMHTPTEWSKILHKYVDKYDKAENRCQDRRRLVQIAAICMAMLEAGSE